MRLFLLIVAAWASIAAATGFFLDQDATASFVIAVLCLAGVFWLDYRAAQRARAARVRDGWLDFDDEYLREVD